MENITIGSQFTTQKSGVTGVVQEVVKNQNGTSRVRLSVDGQDRWTTVKQSNQVGVATTTPTTPN